MKNRQIKGLPLIIAWAALGGLATFLVVIPASTGVPFASTGQFSPNPPPKNYVVSDSFNCTTYEFLPTDIDITKQGITVVLDASTGNILTLDKDLEIIPTATVSWSNFPDLFNVQASAIAIDDRGMLVVADNASKRLIKLRRALDGTRGWIPDDFVRLDTSSEILDVATWNSDTVLVATSTGVIRLVDEIEVDVWDVVTTSLSIDPSGGTVYASAFSNEIYGAGIQKYSHDGFLIDEWYLGADIGPFGVDVGPTGHVYWTRGWKADRSIARTDSQGDQVTYISAEAPIDRSIIDMGRVVVDDDGNVLVIQGSPQECVLRFTAS